MTNKTVSRWSHRDLFRKTHPVGINRAVGDFILSRKITDESPEIIQGFGKMQEAGSVKEVVAILDRYKGLPWETIPTQFLKDEKVWKTLFYNGQLKGQALVRQITRLARMEAFNDLQFAADYAAKLTDEEMIRKTRLHPINFLNAVVVHQTGTTRWIGNPFGYNSYERVFDWKPVSQIVDALNDGFHTSFKTVEPAGKRTMLAIDVSASMTQKALGLDLSCAQVSGAMAMTIARTEPAHIIRGFTTGGNGGYYGRGNAQLTDLGITPKTSLNTAMSNVQKSNFGGTDCAQPMLWAKENGLEIDTFVVITDNETWAGNVKPFQALKQYRKEMGIDARLAVLGVAATDFTIADPSDSGMMDFAGFDANAPRALAEFSAGRI